MIPLTPNERREIEKIKEQVTKVMCRSVYFETIDIDGDTIFADRYSPDLWLKVLSMALEHNDKLSDEWRSRK